jgi:hypothetical protein
MFLYLNSVPPCQPPPLGELDQVKYNEHHYFIAEYRSAIILGDSLININ